MHRTLQPIVRTFFGSHIISKSKTFFFLRQILIASLHCLIAVTMWASRLTKLRRTAIFTAVSNLLVIVFGGFLIIEAYPICDRQYVIPFVLVSVSALVRIGVMIQTGIAQETTAMCILQCPSDGSVVADPVIRRERRIRYKKWLWWSRLSMAVLVLQVVCATYVIFKTTGYFSKDRISSGCVLELDPKSSWWKQKLLVLFMIMISFVALVQCFSGSDVLKWRSFYETHDNAWKQHYREVFDHGLRETLCCLGRYRYMRTMEEDEVYSVAQLLGDLVAYRASGTGHLELLAGLVLLRRDRKSSESCGECIEAPAMYIQEAAALHKFAEAAYTGPLLDFGRNPFLFPCAWLYRQGVLCPWTRSRRPVLVGDNWWRGHAAAFLKYVNLPPEVLRHGRINQVKCEAAYFVVVLHNLRCVVITIRGTETPEDLITNGLCKECVLTAEDLAGLINGNHIHSDVRRSVTSSFPHYGHSGIVEAAREIFMQIEGNHGEHGSKSSGLLSSLLGVGCECFGYEVRVVGHSLGGAIAALLGIRLYHLYPNLRVYAYGPLPCVDLVVANACSEFVTSIIFGNEFSACLSIGSVLRLRAAAIDSLSEYPRADADTIFQLALQFLYNSKRECSGITSAQNQSDYDSGAILGEDLNHQIRRSQTEMSTKGNTEEDIKGFPLWSEANRSGPVKTDNSEFTNYFASEGNSDLGEYSLWVGDRTRDQVDEIHDVKFRNFFAADVNSNIDPVSHFIDVVQSSEIEAANNRPDIYLPGLVIHIVPEPKDSHNALWTPFRLWGKENHYKAYLADREKFKDIVVSPSMFLDHLPWRCRMALEKLLEARQAQSREGTSLHQ